MLILWGKGCDRMMMWDRLVLVYSDLINNFTINNNQQQHTVYTAMMSWYTSMIGRIPLGDMCTFVDTEVINYFI